MTRRIQNLDIQDARLTYFVTVMAQSSIEKKCQIGMKEIFGEIADDGGIGMQPLWDALKSIKRGNNHEEYFNVIREMSDSFAATFIHSKLNQFMKLVYAFGDDSFESIIPNPNKDN